MHPRKTKALRLCWVDVDANYPIASAALDVFCMNRCAGAL